MRVSIAMATYNGGRFLEEQLDSFRKQNRPPDELVVCDDGSMDNSLNILKEFAKVADFYVLVKSNDTNLGYSANFSKAASLCAGDVIFFSDQDDYWFETKIERGLAALEGGSAAVINDQVILGPDGEIWGRKLSNIRSLGYSTRNFVSGCCTAISKEFARLVLPVPREVAYDAWVNILADLLKVRTVIEEPLQTHRRHELNTSQSVFTGRNSSKFSLIKRYGLHDPRHGWKDLIAGLDIYAKRMLDRADLVKLLAGEAALEAALAQVRREQDHYKKRLALLEHSRLTRAPHVYHMWRRGFYDEFAGWLSAAKDMVRP